MSLTKEHRVFSSGINAWSLKQALDAFGIPLRSDCAGGLVPGGTDAPAPGSVLYFTEESSLSAYLTRRNEFEFWPKTFPKDLIDDKPALSRFASSLGLEVVESLPLEAISTSSHFPMLLKGRSSWSGPRKLPRGWVCEDYESFAARLAETKAAGFSPPDFFAQEWLGSSAPNFSVCGFFDAANPARELLAVVIRRVHDRKGLACSAVVEVMEDPANLVAATRSLLHALHFTGPFELEFLQAPDGRFRILELNPRFWMQHAIFIPHGNGLIARYLSMNPPDTRMPETSPVPAGTTWINTLWLVRQLLTGHWKSAQPWVLRTIKHKDKVVLAPDLRTAILVVAKRAIERLVRRPSSRLE